MHSGAGLVPGEADPKTGDLHRKYTGEHSGTHAWRGSRTGHGEKLGVAAVATRPYLADAMGSSEAGWPYSIGVRGLGL